MGQDALILTLGFMYVPSLCACCKGSGKTAFVQGGLSQYQNLKVFTTMHKVYLCVAIAENKLS